MSLENERIYKPLKSKNPSKKLYLNKSAYVSFRTNDEKPIRPRSQMTNKRKKIEYGTTALKNARLSLEKLRDKKEADLFSMLQHKIKSEFLKYKTYDNYKKRQNHFDLLQDRRYQRIQNNNYDRQLWDNDRQETHYFLSEHQNQLKKDKINKYKYMIKQKENRIISNRLNKNKDLQDKKYDEEMKNQEVQYRLNSLNNQDIKRRNMIDKIMKEKDEKRMIKLAQKANEKRTIMEQKNMEKRIGIDNFLENRKNDQEKIYKIYKTKEKKEMERLDKLNQKKENKRKDIEMINQNRFINHEYCLELIQNNIDQRNKYYFNKQKIIEENQKMNQIKKEQKKEEKRQMMEDKNDIIQFNLNNCEIISNNFRQKVQNKILDREKKTEEIMLKKKLEHMKKQQDNNEKLKEKKNVIQQIELDDSFKRNKKREELDEKKQKINDFLNEKQMINENKVCINDNFNNEYNFYSKKINEMMYKRPMDKSSLKNIQEMFYDNQKLAGMIQNIDK